MTTLKKGSRGQEVKTLQQKLHLIDDGIFGVLTEEAVKEFQKANGLTADGIVGPKTWAALGFSSTSKRAITEIIIHCSATPEGENFTVDQIRDWHMRGNGWSDIGYHFVIYLDGSVHKGRDINKAGAHCTGHNTHSIGICYIGGCAPRSTIGWANISKDTRTQQQKSALIKLIKELKSQYPGTKINVYGHRDFSIKPCPAFDAKTEYASL